MQICIYKCLQNDISPVLSGFFLYLVQDPVLYQEINFFQMIFDMLDKW